MKIHAETRRNSEQGAMNYNDVGEIVSEISDFFAKLAKS